MRRVAYDALYRNPRRGGRFTSETSWMVHAWIWKESPAGVFSPTNPLVK